MRILLACLLLVMSTAWALAQDLTLITNVHVFDGKNEKRIENANVLIEGNLIKQVWPAPDRDTRD